MTPREARRILGMVNGYTVEGVETQFRVFAKANHPDNGGTGLGLCDAKEARDVLISALGGETACNQCLGRGYIKARLGSVECGRCNGEGTAAI